MKPIEHPYSSSTIRTKDAPCIINHCKHYYVVTVLVRSFWVKFLTENTWPESFLTEIVLLVNLYNVHIQGVTVTVRYKLYFFGTEMAVF